MDMYHFKWYIKKNGRYDIFSQVFTLPPVRTINEYSSIGGNNKYGVLYDVLANIRNDSKKDKHIEWPRHVLLKFDTCHITGKTVLNI